MLIPPADAAAYAQCREHAVEPCYDVRHGVISIANGAYNVRISGTPGHRAAAVCSADGRNCEDPPLAIPSPIGLDGVVRGAFRVCPLQKVRPGHLPITCLAGASGVRLEHPRGLRPPPISGKVARPERP